MLTDALTNFDGLDDFLPLLSQPLFLAFLAVVCTLLLIGLIRRSRREKRFKSASFTKIDGMTGVEFEEFVAEVLRRNGYSRVAVTKASGDFGVDIIAYRGYEKWVFQCKRYNKNLGIKPIQEVFTGMHHYKANRAGVVINNYFTQNAVTLADELNVKLIGRLELTEMIKRAKQSNR